MARLVVRLVPFRRIAGRLREDGGEPPPSELERGARNRARRIGWAVEAAAARLPWTCTCLVRALAAQRMARRRHLPSTLYLAVAGEGDDGAGLEAHAWLRCGDEVVTGAAGRERYTVIASFGHPGRRPTR